MSKPTRREEPEPPPVITDKRHTARPMPTAEELMEQTDAPAEMTEEEKEALLAKQAAELEPIPYEGAGVGVEAKADIPQYLTAFTVLVPRDGPPEVIPVTIPMIPEQPELGDEELQQFPAYAIDRDLLGRDLWLACSEIIWNIQVSEQSRAGVMANMGAAAGMARSRQAQMDAETALRRANGSKKKH